MAAIANFFNEFLLAFIPLFVAVDALGVLPLFLVLTEGMNSQEQAKTLRYAMLTALGLGLGFAGLGKVVLNFMGVTAADFIVAGGLILFLLAARNLLVGERKETVGGEVVGVFPVGVPLVVGPAVLTTLLVLIDRYSVAPVLIAFLINLGIAWLVFAQAPIISRLLGKGGLAVASKIAMLLLAAIAVKMIDLGLRQLITGS